MYTALIIDDIPNNIALLSSFLSLYEVESIPATNGREGFDLAIQHLPDIVLVDLRMPEYSWTGYEASRQLRAHPATRHIPIIAVTASGDDTAALEAGCDAVLFRPFRTGQLRDILLGYLPDMLEYKKGH